VTKKDMARAIAEQSGIPQAQALAIVQRVFDGIVETLLTERRIELRNFGVFEIRQRQPRQGRNPRTGERVAVPPKAVVTFKPGREMAERVARLGEGPHGAPDESQAAIEGSTTGEREAT
jgi:integration host factor subunit beta